MTAPDRRPGQTARYHRLVQSPRARRDPDDRAATGQNFLEFSVSCGYPFFESLETARFDTCAIGKTAILFLLLPSVTSRQNLTGREREKPSRYRSRIVSKRTMSA